MGPPELSRDKSYSGPHLCLLGPLAHRGGWRPLKMNQKILDFFQGFQSLLGGSLNKEILGGLLARTQCT